MNEKFVAVKAALAAFFTALGAFLGWKGVMALVWLGVMALVTSGIADLVMMVICQHMPFGLTWPGAVLPLVLAWYIITELGSILENAIKLGANVPGWLVKLLKAGAKIVEKAGDSVVTEE